MASPLHPPGLMARITQAAARMDPALTERDIERLVKQTHRRARRRNRGRLGLGVATVGLLGLVVLGFRERQGPPGRDIATAHPGGASAPAVAGGGQGTALRLADGSTATSLDGASRLTVVEDSPRRITIDLTRGRGRFEVARAPTRLFEVRAGDVVVRVVGTVFAIERVADRVGVTVERGTVNVTWGVGEQSLRAGESGWFPPLQIKSNSPTAAASAAAAASSATAAASSAAAGAGAASASAEELLRAADTARVAGHAKQGATLLRRLLDEHHRDPRAPLAAFTLGRILMIELAQPGQAAAAFARARTLAPNGPFAEDALAREVEALAKAGEAMDAKKKAREYSRLYPNGRRAASVRAFGGIE